MSVYHILLINRAGSLIYDWENRSGENVVLERTFTYPTGIVLEVIDQRPTVVFGEKDNICLRYAVAAVNGRRLKGTLDAWDAYQRMKKYQRQWIPSGQMLSIEDGGELLDFMDYIEEPTNFPVTLTFSPPRLSSNEKIILGSMFHSLFTISAQLSPAIKSTGIELLETTQFKLRCFQSITGVKLVILAANDAPQNLDQLLRKLYELYADFALKNPFYSIDMPIRAEKFDEAIRTLMEKTEKFPNMPIQ